MTNLAELAQPGALSDPTAFAEYLTFSLRDADVTPDRLAAALSMVSNAARSIGQKDPDGLVSATIGFGARAWPVLCGDRPLPDGLVPFPELADGPRRFPATPGDIFVMVKSSRIDLAFQTAKYIVAGFAPLADVVEDTCGFKYLDDRDLIDFVDGTENPHRQARVAAVLTPGGDYQGGSYLVVQRYRDRQADWDALSTEQQEQVIGRTKLDDIELPDDQKQPYAHTVRSKVEREGAEIKMYRQNRAYGTAVEHGTVFVGFAATLDTLLTSLRQMIIADADGAYDHLLDFVVAETGNSYFVPPLGLLAELGG